MVWNVFLAGLLTALFTGFGALPFAFVKKIQPRTMGIANALAAGLMLGASLGLVVEGAEYSLTRVGIGILLGMIMVVFAHDFIDRYDVDFGEIGQADGRKMLLIVGVMFVHSFAEGIGVGVSFGGEHGDTLGRVITTAIAIHNIPEGLAIALIMIPRGTSVLRASWWGIFSSLPQPFMAVLSFLFVLAFEPFLPIGLGLAGGAMIWMVFSELIPEAQEKVSTSTAVVTMAFATLVMMAFQDFLA